MKIALFGASGRTGQHVLAQALGVGHDVTVLVRDPSRVNRQDRHLKIIKGNIQDAAQLKEAVSGAQAVISVLGPTQNKPAYEISTGTENIIAAMKNLGVRRLIVSTGAGVTDPNDTPGPFNQLMNFLVQAFSRFIYKDMVEVASKIRASNLDWTIVRVPMLTDEPHTGKIRVGYVGRGIGMRIGRGDMADFILQQLTDDTYLQRAPAISN
jgi:putative NADH-flavin reductase